MTTQTLIERLRFYDNLSLCREAADALEARDAEIERLQAEAEQLRKGHFDVSETAAGLRAELAALKAQPSHVAQEAAITQQKGDR